MPLLRLMSFLRLMSLIRLISIFSRRKKKRESKSGALQEGYATESDCEEWPSSKKLKTNKYGQKCFKNGVVSMRAQDPNLKLSSRQHYEGALPFPTEPPGRLNLGSAYTVWTLVSNEKKMPIEKNFQVELCALIFLSAAPYALTQDQIDHVMSCPELERDAWLIGYAKSAQQKLWYI